jgi:hypothetical protein
MEAIDPDGGRLKGPADQCSPRVGGLPVTQDLIFYGHLPSLQGEAART